MPSRPIKDLSGEWYVNIALYKACVMETRITILQTTFYFCSNENVWISIEVNWYLTEASSYNGSIDIKTASVRKGNSAEQASDKSLPNKKLTKIYDATWRH